MQTLADTQGEEINMELIGIIDEKEAHVLRRMKSELAGEGPYTVVFDFSKVTFIGSSGLGSLIQLYKAVAPNGGKVCLENVPRSIANMLRVVNLDKVFQMAP